MAYCYALLPYRRTSGSLLCNPRCASLAVFAWNDIPSPDDSLATATSIAKLNVVRYMPFYPAHRLFAIWPRGGKVFHSRLRLRAYMPDTCWTHAVHAPAAAGTFLPAI